MLMGDVLMGVGAGSSLEIKAEDLAGGELKC